MADGGRLGLTPARLAALARCAIKGASRPRRGLHLVTAHYDGSGVAEEYAERLAMSAKRMGLVLVFVVVGHIDH